MFLKHRVKVTWKHAESLGSKCRVAQRDAFMSPAPPISASMSTFLFAQTSKYHDNHTSYYCASASIVLYEDLGF